MRVYPHFQNTGGFFIAVIEKTGSLCSMDQLIAAGQVNPTKGLNIAALPSDETVEVAPVACTRPLPAVVSSETHSTKRLSKSASWNDPYLFQTSESTAILAVQ